MSDPEAELSQTAWAVLGVLSFPGDRSGYEVKSWVDRSLRFFYWSPALSQIYRELKKLESVGYVSSYLAPQDELRNKRLYRITDAGRDAVTNWAASSPATPPVLKHGVLLRVWLGHLLGTEQLRAVLAAHIDYAERMRAEAAELEASAHRQKLWPYPELALRWSTRYYESEAELARRLLKDLDEMDAREMDARETPER
jgi:DNA-binding PadR family transcriptional regulator